MQTTHAAKASPEAATPHSTATKPDANADSQWQNYHIIRRNGAVVGFEPGKMAIALTKAFLAVNGGQGAASARVRELVANLTTQAIKALTRNHPSGGTFHIEEIQDQVELALMRSGEHEVARAYVLYREKRSQERARAGQADAPPQQNTLNVTDNGVKRPLDLAQLRATIAEAGLNLPNVIDADAILRETVKNLYDGIPVDEVFKSAILSARALVETDPSYSLVTARLLLHTIRKEVLGEEVSQAAMTTRYAEYFPQFIKVGVEGGLLDRKLAQFDLPKLAAALNAQRDQQFNYLGLQTLYDRYFLHLHNRRIELPQIFFM
ncbi:MAG: ATP cone domain-containing protein, partial [Burkholderiaceae bacterium]